MEITKTRFYAFVALVLCVMAFLQVTSVRRESQTVDEGVYIAAGYAQLRLGDDHLNREHPPLGKLLQAIPLLFMGLRLPTDDPSWRSGDQYAFAQRFLYANTRSPDAILFVARCVTIILTILFGLTLAIWVRRRAGDWPAAIALVMFAFDPNILAHGRYATEDLPLAFFLFLAVVLWGRALRTLRPLDFAVAGLAIGAAMFSKASGILVVPIVLLLAVQRFRRPWPALRGVLIASVVGLAVGMATYFFWVDHYRMVIWMTEDHTRAGQVADLFEHVTTHGLWYFYPAVAALKTPIAVFELALFAVVVFAWRRPRVPDAATLLVPTVVYGIACLTSPIDIGVRILLPIYPLAYALIALVLAEFRPRLIAGVLLAALVVESTLVYPNYLAFFNAFAGGPGGGVRYLVDSNLDWGQSSKELKVWLDAHGDSAACVAYFGQADPAYYGVKELPWSRTTRPDCLLAVSATVLFAGAPFGDERLFWLRNLQPIAKIGASIYVYDLRAKT